VRNSQPPVDEAIRFVSDKSKDISSVTAMAKDEEENTTNQVFF
jgi:hypothetical protein